MHLTAPQVVIVLPPALVLLAVGRLAGFQVGHGIVTIRLFDEGIDQPHIIIFAGARARPYIAEAGLGLRGPETKDNDPPIERHAVFPKFETDDARDVCSVGFP